jgi:hypothetical protein
MFLDDSWIDVSHLQVWLGAGHNLPTANPRVKMEPAATRIPTAEPACQSGVRTRVDASGAIEILSDSEPEDSSAYLLPLTRWLF